MDDSWKGGSDPQEYVDSLKAPMTSSTEALRPATVTEADRYMVECARAFCDDINGPEMALLFAQAREAATATARREGMEAAAKLCEVKYPHMAKLIRAQMEKPDAR